MNEAGEYVYIEAENRYVHNVHNCCLENAFLVQIRAVGAQCTLRGEIAPGCAIGWRRGSCHWDGNINPGQLIIRTDLFQPYYSQESLSEEPLPFDFDVGHNLPSFGVFLQSASLSIYNDVVQSATVSNYNNAVHSATVSNHNDVVHSVPVSTYNYAVQRAMVSNYNDAVQSVMVSNYNDVIHRVPVPIDLQRTSI